MKRFIKVFVFLAVVAAVAYAYFAWRRTMRQDEEPVPVRAVTNRTIIARVEETGRIQPKHQVVIKSEVNGRIEHIHVEDGDTVTAGCVLVELDKIDLLNRKCELELDRREALLNLERAQLDYTRTRELYKQEHVSSDEYDQMRIERDLKHTRVAKIDSQITTVKDEILKSIISAPAPGTIINRDIEVGEVAIGASSVSSGTELMKIANLDVLEVRTRINEVDISSIQTGMQVDVATDSLPGHIFTGTVEKIAPVAETGQSDQVQGFEVCVLLGSAFVGLRPGMTANLSFTLNVETNALVVPLAAVFCDDYEAAPVNQTFYVFVQTPTNFHRQAVWIGIHDNESMQLVSGITENVSVSLERPPPTGMKKRKHAEWGRRGRRRR